MQRLGIQTGADLRTKSLAFLQQHFGKSAAWYLGIANGQDDRPVERDLIASAEIEAGVEAMADDVWAWCDKAMAFGRTVTVKVKFADFRQVAPRISQSRFRPFARRRGSAQVDPRPTLTAAGSED
jgi:DNA polymerase IV